MEEETKSPKQEEERRGLTSCLQADEVEFPSCSARPWGGSGQASSGEQGTMKCCEGTGAIELTHYHLHVSFKSQKRESISLAEPEGLEEGHLPAVPLSSVYSCAAAPPSDTNRLLLPWRHS